MVSEITPISSGGASADERPLVWKDPVILAGVGVDADFADIFAIRGLDIGSASPAGPVRPR